ncbi:MAG: hypothetical protein HC898_12690 [Phycisphaerales bacterium]|nr:hypothetical protein [Phycisphaerales bacterium]
MFTRHLTNFRKHTLITTLAAAGLCGLTASTNALTLGAGGLVSDWGIKPFDASLQPVDTTSVVRTTLPRSTMADPSVFGQAAAKPTTLRNCTSATSAPVFRCCW